MICRKSREKLLPLRGSVGVPPVQVTKIVWLIRSLVWLTVTCRPENGPCPGTVTAEPLGGPAAVAGTAVAGTAVAGAAAGASTADGVSTRPTSAATATVAPAARTLPARPLPAR